MRHLYIFYLIIALAPARADDKRVGRDFSSYPQTEGFRHHVSMNTNQAVHVQQNNILAICAFPKGNSFALEYFVTESGQASDWRNVWDWAIQDSHKKQLPESDLKSLRLAIRELPPESALPAIERLVIVSFRDGTNWVPRSYDSGSLPKPMHQIYDIVGERFESKPPK